MDETKGRLHATIEGIVQGVGFRYFVKENADRLGITGWVRNRWDDSVEVLADGDRSQVERLLEVLRRGPRAAYVSNVKVDWQEPEGEFASFSIRMTD